MLTILACPKPFEDTHIATIQRNAITSWTLLKPRPEIILFGDETGVAEICRDLDLRHVPDIVRNEFGTPLLNDIFQKGQNLATWPIICYINADIILLDDFQRIVEIVSQIDREFLVVGQRWDLDIAGPIDFSSPMWAENLRTLAKTAGRLASPDTIDYFVFSKGLFLELPPFAVGRGFFDIWLLWYAMRRRRALAIDATSSVTIIHQSHTYFHLPGVEHWYTESPEALRNRALAGGWRHWVTIFDVRNVLRHNKIEHAGLTRLIRASFLRYWQLLLILSAPARFRVGLRRSAARRIMNSLKNSK